MTETIQAVIVEARALLEREYGDRLAGVVLFGWHARGDAGPGSDVDLLVVLRDEVAASAEVSRLSSPLAELSLRHDTVVSCAFVSEARYASEQSPFLLNVRAPMRSSSSATLRSRAGCDSWSQWAPHA